MRDVVFLQVLLMPIPNFQGMMTPLLRAVSDGKEHRLRDKYDEIADDLALSEDERLEQLPSGNNLLQNRTQWAKFYLSRAGLLETPRRGVVQITQRGLDCLKKYPEQIDSSVLAQFPEFVEFRNQKPDAGRESLSDETTDSERTPDEMLEYAHDQLQRTLASEIETQVKEVSPAFFEKLVVDLLLAMGYGGAIEDAGRVLGRSGDGGVDGIIKEDRLGLDVVYLQAKRWEGVVGRPEIQKFAGALQGQRAKKGVFITTSSFTKEAQEFAGAIENKVVLIDGRKLAQLMIRFDVGVAVERSFLKKRLDTDYFAED